MESPGDFFRTDVAQSGATAVPGRILRIRDDVFDCPVFILTADVDWASDYCIDTLVSFSHERGITPTLFVTHDSPVIAALRAQGRVECGIHPNFLPGSSHGDKTGDVIAYMLSVVPQPIAVRCHHYTENSEISHMLAATGVRVDSNVCLFLQQALKPLYHWSGLMRLPCFWEDDTHWERGFAWNFARLRKLFFEPGLKILNVHPFMFALNIPDAMFYASHKHHIPTLDAPSAGRLRFPGQGSATFLAEIIDAVRGEGLHFTTMSELVSDLSMEWIEP
jgi:hypothetical protein